MLKKIKIKMSNDFNEHVYSFGIFLNKNEYIICLYQIYLYLCSIITNKICYSNDK
jgi:hypothetical protein